MLNLGNLTGYFEKAPSASHIQANINPGEQQPFSCLALQSALTSTQCIRLFSLWAMWLLKPHMCYSHIGPWPPRGSLICSLACLVRHGPCIYILSHLQVHNLVAIPAARSRDSRRKPEMITVWDKLNYLEGHLAIACGL